MDPHSAIRTVTVVDLARYNDICGILQSQGGGASAVEHLNSEIAGLLDRAISERSVSPLRREGTGDGAVLIFETAEAAFGCAMGLHLAASQHNGGNHGTLQQRHFRVGISTGEVTLSNEGMAGTAIAVATRLEGKAKTGEVLICSETWAALSPESRKRFGPEEEVHGKRPSERYRAHRCRVIEAAPWEAKCFTPRGRLIAWVALVVLAGGVGLLLAFLSKERPAARPNAQTFDYWGIVEDASDGGSVRAVVEVLEIEAAPILLKTDSAGRFHCRLARQSPSAPALLRVTAPGFEPLERHLVLLPNQEVPLKASRIIVTAPQAKFAPPLAPATPAADTSSRHNFFLDAASPRRWFERSKFYTRSDEEGDRRRGDDSIAPLLKRHYTSADAGIAGPFGPGWHHQFESHLDLHNSTLGRIIYVDESGARIEFKPAIDEKPMLDAVRRFIPNATLATRLAAAFEVERNAEMPFFLSTLKNLSYVGADFTIWELSFVREMVRIRVNDNSLYLFNRDGRIVRVERPLEPPLEIRYDPAFPDRIARLSAGGQSGRNADLRYDDAGRIIRLSFVGGTSYEYKYDGRGCLISVRDESESDVRLRYAYDAADRLVNAGGEIKYDAAGWRDELIGADGRVRWEFDDAHRMPSVLVSFLEPAGNAKQLRFTFNDDDQTITMEKQRQGRWPLDSAADLQEMDGPLIEPEARTVYRITPCGCKPLAVIDRGKETDFEYDDTGRLVRATTPDAITLVSYHPKWFDAKVSVKKVSRREAKTLRDVTIEVDERGNESRAVDHVTATEAVKEHDNRNRESALIWRGTDGPEKVVRYRYGANGKPDQIAIRGVGSLEATYLPNKVIDRVETRVEGVPDPTDQQKSAVLKEIKGADRQVRALFAAEHIDTRYTQIYGTIQDDTAD